MLFNTLDLISTQNLRVSSNRLRFMLRDTAGQLLSTIGPLQITVYGAFAKNHKKDKSIMINLFMF